MSSEFRRTGAPRSLFKYYRQLIRAYWETRFFHQTIIQDRLHLINGLIHPTSAPTAIEQVELILNQISSRIKDELCLWIYEAAY